MLKRVSVGHQNILTLVDYFETMNNCTYHISRVSVEVGKGKKANDIRVSQYTWSLTSPSVVNYSTASAVKAATTSLMPQTSSARFSPQLLTCTTMESCIVT